MNRQFSYPFIAAGIGALMAATSSKAASAQVITPDFSTNAADLGGEALTVSNRTGTSHTGSDTAQPVIEATTEGVTVFFTPKRDNASNNSKTDKSINLAKDIQPVVETEEAAIAPDEIPPIREIEFNQEGNSTTETVQSPEPPTSITAPTPDREVLEATQESVTPDSLNPDNNPLSLPTQPEQVEITNVQPITLEQAIALALRNDPQLQIAALELSRSRAVVREARSARLPTLELSSGLTVQEAQQNPLSDQISQLLPNLETSEDDADINLQGTLRLNYDLYTGGRRSATIRAATARVRLQELQVNAVSEQLRLNVTSSYYDLQQADEQVRIARAAVEQAQQNLRDTQALQQAGLGTRFDILQAEVNVANFRQELNQALSTQRTAQRQLAQRLNLAQQADITTADPVVMAEAWGLSLEESIVLSFQNRAELRQQLIQREINEQQRRIEVARNRPQISLFAQYDVSDALNRDEDVDDTYRFGVQMSWRLFDGGLSRARADQSEIDGLIAEQRFADTRNQIRFQVEEAYLSLQANRNNVETARLAVVQATEALRLARLRFQAGVGTQTDVLRSQTELTRSEVNLLQATLGYNRSLITLRRAVSDVSQIGA